VAFACRALEAGTIEHGYAAATEPDQPGIAQSARGCGHTLSAHTERGSRATHFCLATPAASRFLKWGLMNDDPTDRRQ
jgi:hypothetical protein